MNKWKEEEKERRMIYHCGILNGRRRGRGKRRWYKTGCSNAKQGGGWMDVGEAGAGLGEEESVSSVSSAAPATGTPPSK